MQRIRLASQVFVLHETRELRPMPGTFVLADVSRSPGQFSMGERPIAPGVELAMRRVCCWTLPFRSTEAVDSLRRPRLPVAAWSRLLSLRVCRLTAQAVEAAVVVEVDRRVRAVAARFEYEQTGWRCAAVRIL